MAVEELLASLQNLGKDASRLIFEDELTGVYNRRYLLHYFEHKVTWEGEERQPVSLIMMDLDHFKQINDAHGHLVGDQALIHIAKLLKEVAGDEGLPIRYAGDEFMILLPGMRKLAAMQVGEKLVQRCRQEPLTVEEGSSSLNLTLSMGCASAPDDAQSGRALIQKADAALYFAKKSGRNRLANATDVATKDVPQKAAIQNLRGATIVGRHQQLAQVTEMYDRFVQGESQFILVEGAAGMGRSTFLDTIYQALTRKDYKVVKVSGVQQEGYRPYYLLTAILRAFLNQLPDKGAALFESLSSKEMACLFQVLPHLNGTAGVEMGGGGGEEEDEASQRESIFSMLVNFLPRLVEYEPFIVLIDDLQFVDPGTLLLLRRLILRREVPLFLCGSALSGMQASEEGQATPLDRFWADYQQELNLQKVTLTPLVAADIQHHLRGLFPQIDVTEEFQKDLLRISQGNPLILSEVVRKLVLDQKITLVGQHWTLQPLEEGYLPKSLDEIINQKISALDEESRKILEHVSTLGEDVPVSMLTGSTEKMESKIEEFIERSAELGLISSDYRDNDEIIRFLGKRVRDITYGNIDQHDREQLHEQVGSYQEKLFDQKLLPSASYLAYHFKRSANREKASRYEEMQASYNSKVFDAEEAVNYTGDLPADSLPDTPLDAEGLAAVPVVIRSLLTAVRTVKLYPAESKTVVNTNLQVIDAVNKVLATNPHLKIAQEEDALLVNGQKIDVSEYKTFADNFLEFLRGVELGTLAFQSGLNPNEMQAFLSAFAQIKPAETLDQRFWKHFAVKRRLTHIHLKQVKYSERGLRKDDSGPVVVPPALRLKQDGLAQIHEIIRSLLSTSKNIKIYPLKSKTVTTSLEQLMGSLSGVLERQAALTLSKAGTSLLINGDKVDTSEFKAVADGFLEFLDSIHLSSLTFRRGVTMQEVEGFVAKFRELPSTGATADVWKELNQTQTCTNILFDQYLYGIELEAGGAEEAGTEPEPAPEPELQLQEEPVEELEQAEQEESFDTFVAAFPDRVNSLLLKGETDSVRKMISRLFNEYKAQDMKVRDKVLDACRRALNSAPMGFKQEFIKLLSEPLLAVGPEEKDAKLIGVVGETLHKMAEDLLPFADYLPATRIFSQLLALKNQFEKGKDPRAKALAKVMDRKLDSKTQSLLVEDLKSGESSKQQVAAQLLGSLGSGSQPMLIEVIKQEEDLRVRQIAAGLLAQLSAKAGEQLKQALVLEVTAQGRYRILEVIDTVTRSLQAELSFALGDENRRVRKAAFQLAERLNDKEVWTLLMNHTTSEETGLATGAIKCLGKLKPPGASEQLVSLLNSTKETERAIACCQALGQISDTGSIEALARVLAAKGFLFFGKRWNAQVRAAAAFALRQMPRARVAQVLRPLSQDRDPRVRQIAKSFARG